MSIYKEVGGKLQLKVIENGKPVTVSVDCENGTEGGISWFYGGLKDVSCGQKNDIGDGGDLQNKSITFDGSSGNPSGSPVKIIHTFEQEGGNSLTYTFPDDYTGSPDFDPDDSQPSYMFNLKFI